MAHSSYLDGAVGFFAGALAIAWLGPELLARLTRAMRECLEMAGRAGADRELSGAIATSLWAVGQLLVIAIGCAALGAVGAGLVQTRGSWSAPGSRAGGPTASPPRWVAPARVALALPMLAALGGEFIARHAGDLPHLSRMPATRAAEVVASLSAALVARGGVALLAVGVLDHLVQRWCHARAMQMTPEEKRRELRDVEGPPHGKLHRRRMHRELVAPDASLIGRSRSARRGR